MSTIKTIGIFSVGFACGAFFMHQYLNKKLDEKLINEIDAIERFYEEKAKPIGEKISEKVDEVADDVKKKFRVTLDKAGYNKLNDESEDDIFEDEDVDPAEEEHPQDDKPDPQPAYRISQAEFYNGYNYQKVTLTYYEAVDVLAEDDDILDNTEYIVGNDFKDHFGDEEENVVYVRNERLFTDYEIILDQTDAETVGEILGYEGTDKN